LVPRRQPQSFMQRLHLNQGGSLSSAFFHQALPHDLVSPRRPSRTATRRPQSAP
jgi:hypothetical protein